jgi:hypothetical protein
MCIRKTATLAILCFFLVSLGAFCQSKEMTQQDPAAIRKLVKVRDGLAVPEDVIKKLIGKILEDNGNLTADFSRGNFIDVAKRLDKRGTSLVTHKYEKLHGKDSAGFWRDSAAGGAALALVVDAIFITDVVGTQTVDVCLPDAKTSALAAQSITYNYIASVTQEFHVIETGAAKGNATSFGAQVYRHQDTCVWE